MMRLLGVLTCAGIVVLTGGVARAQSAPTCAFDPATAHVTVSVNGLDAHLQAVASSGDIWLNGVPCAGATVFNTDSIEVNGGIPFNPTIERRYWHGFLERGEWRSA